MEQSFLPSGPEAFWTGSAGVGPSGPEAELEFSHVDKRRFLKPFDLSALSFVCLPGIYSKLHTPNYFPVTSAVLL
jgi:hypothetical protein